MPTTIIEYLNIFAIVWFGCGVIAVIVALVDDIYMSIKWHSLNDDLSSFVGILKLVAGRIAASAILWLLGPISIVLGVFYFIEKYHESLERKRRGDRRGR